MLPRKTQTAEYWKGIKIEEHDIENLYEFFLEEELPCTAFSLSLALVKGRCEREEAFIKERLSQGTLFQPRGSYKIGEKLVFPALDYSIGIVVGERKGYNPKYGEFNVIQVRFEGEEGKREFASEFPNPHKLNIEEVVPSGLLSPEEILSLYGEGLQERLVERLRESEDFVEFGGEWFLKGLLADVRIGHLNIAEAMLDLAGKPLRTEELLEELELPADMKMEAKVFSLNYAIVGDERFEDVGSGQVLWFLRRLIPKEASHPPRFLVYKPEPYERDYLDEEMLRLEEEIDDELVERDSEEDVESATIVLNYPHLRSGTIPLTAKTKSLFPKGGKRYTYVNLLDGRTGKSIAGWVVHRHNYVYGLLDWYEKNNVPVGAYIRLFRTDEPMKVGVDLITRRKERPWIRVAKEVEGRLVFEMQKRKSPISCEYDDFIILEEEDPSGIDELRMGMEGRPLFDVMREVFPELAKLDPRGIVHAKTLYSAINLVRRSPPGPIFAELASRDFFSPVGGGYWRISDEKKEVGEA